MFLFASMIVLAIRCLILSFSLFPVLSELHASYGQENAEFLHVGILWIRNATFALIDYWYSKLYLIGATSLCTLFWKSYSYQSYNIVTTVVHVGELHFLLQSCMQYMYRLLFKSKNLPLRVWRLILFCISWKKKNPWLNMFFQISLRWSSLSSQQSWNFIFLALPRTICYILVCSRNGICDSYARLLV